MRVLHAAAEIFPLVKTGGLADVVGALPQALVRAGADVRLLLPGLPPILAGLEQQQKVWEGGPLFGAARVTLLRGRIGGVPAYVVDAPYLYRRPGNPYLAADGSEWSDNLQRFGLLGWIGAHLAAGDLDGLWVPEVLHVHDWHAAMACAYVHAHPGTRATTVFTVHNLAFQGLFDEADFGMLGLPARLMGLEGLEFHGQLSFMKAGLTYADHVTTVSPTYAREIRSAEFGSGLDGVLRARGDAVSGILNGVDGAVWNPARDPAIASPYSVDQPEGKALCKAALQQALGLRVDAQAPLFVAVSRLTSQKGLDLVLTALPTLIQLGGQLAILGTGDADLEQAFAAAQSLYPGVVAVRLSYNEELAHRMVAGADIVLVPSRFEPCGLTQLYGLRYGSLPLVRRVGGLVDTVVDAGQGPELVPQATGFQFVTATPAALAVAMQRAVQRYRMPAQWQQLVHQAMSQDFSWERAAQQYMALYRRLLPA